MISNPTCARTETRGRLVGRRILFPHVSGTTLKVRVRQICRSVMRLPLFPQSLQANDLLPLIDRAMLSTAAFLAAKDLLSLCSRSNNNAFPQRTSSGLCGKDHARPRLNPSVVCIYGEKKEGRKKKWSQLR